jgi:2-methylaconitate cis-trans-isomerase PrpF
LESQQNSVRVGTPAGVVEVAADVRKTTQGLWEAQSVGLTRTARVLTEGKFYID